MGNVVSVWSSSKSIPVTIAGMARFGTRLILDLKGARDGQAATDPRSQSPAPRDLLHE